MLLASLAPLPATAQSKVDFSRDIQPILSQKCTVCHGPALQQSGLRLDNQNDAMKGGKSGAVIRPGNSSASVLIKRLEGLDDLQRMPPGQPLPAGQIELFHAWIDQGAEWGTSSETSTPDNGHWSFHPIRRPSVPEVSREGWVRNPIDAFILARLEAEGVEPSPEAAPSTLLRRTWLDLVGLPPSPRDLAGPANHEQVVESLLDSDHFGERWAAPWLDQVRYADSDGYEKDSVRPHAWRYRHWVINALNADMPFDQFTIEQLAGDLLPGATTEQRVATGFYRNTLKNREGGVDVEQFRFEEVVDRTNTVATVWLGLSVECARCHDHKFDPISQKDYYRLFAFFNELDEVDIDAPLQGEIGPYLQAKPDLDAKIEQLYRKYKVRELQRPWEAKMLWAGDNPGVEHQWDTSWDIIDLYLDHGQRILRTPPESRTGRENYAVTEWFMRNYSRVTTKDEYAATGFKQAVKELHEIVDAFPDVSRARAIEVSREPRPSHIHEAGEWNELGEWVSPGALAVLPALDHTDETPTRLDLARWLVSDKNPLTARVVVNRLWQEYFGAGLSPTANNFGLQGEPPSHPELLDWLAAELIDSGWSLKHIHRLIATSATYRQSSATREDLTEKDPGNRLLARQIRLRLPAEILRDAALSAAGLLDPKIGGKSVRPRQPEGVAELGYAGSVRWHESAGSDKYRRGVYVHYQRMTPYPFLANFDLGERNVTDCTRERSNTPLQALNLLNDPVFFEMAQGLALRTLSEAPRTSFDSRLGHAYKLCVAREPRVTEKEELLGYFVKQRELVEADAEMAKAWFPPQLDGIERTEAAAWVGVIRILLNLDEFITRE
ncbi:MAG: PSD1 and planctomycete cytochrome C domain-containing protein [Acidobacteria bacterium]|nr:PSD1 and planctomycete cytochrome C domain-containing protein [Acidobacteriota bacterium]